MSDSSVEDYDWASAEGVDVGKESAKNSGGAARRMEYFRLKDGESMLVRLLTPMARTTPGQPKNKHEIAWTDMRVHQFATPKPKPDYLGKDDKWPKGISAVCRKDRVFAKKYNNECLVCDQGDRPAPLMFAIAVQREAVKDPKSGRITGFRDVMREVMAEDDDGNYIPETDANGNPKTREDGKPIYKRETSPAYVLMQMRYNNFYRMWEAQANHYSLLSRDYEIRRDGEGSDTVYLFQPMDKIVLGADNEFGLPAGTDYDMELPVGTDDDGREITLREVLYPDMPDIRKIITRQVTDDYFGRWFDPSYVPPDAKNQGGSRKGSGDGVHSGYTPPKNEDAAQSRAESADPETPVKESEPAPDEDRLAALRRRVMQGK